MIWPSAWALLQGVVSAARMASPSCSSPAAKVSTVRTARHTCESRPTRRQRIGAGGHGQGLEQPGSGLCARCHANGTLRGGELPRPRGQQAQRTLRERAAGALRIPTTEATYAQLELHGAPSGGLVSRASNVTAMYQVTWCVAEGTSGS